MKTDKLYESEMFNKKKDTSAEEKRLTEEKYFNDILNEQIISIKETLADLRYNITRTEEEIKRYKIKLTINERLLDPLLNDLVESDKRIEKIESTIEEK
jgi:hypothetical protein